MTTVKWHSVSKLYVLIQESVSLALLQGTQFTIDQGGVISRQTPGAGPEGIHENLACLLSSI